jgi:hypothetical protein
VYLLFTFPVDKLYTDWVKGIYVCFDIYLNRYMQVVNPNQDTPVARNGS